MVENMGYTVIDAKGANIVSGSGAGISIAGASEKVALGKPVLLVNFKVDSVARTPAFVMFKAVSSTQYKGFFEIALTSSKLTVYDVEITTSDAVYINKTEKEFA